MKKAISIILITLVVMVLPALSVAKTYVMTHHGYVAVASSVDQHSHEHEDASHHNDHRCCHGHLQLVSLPHRFDQAYYSSLRAKHATEYRFVVLTACLFPEFRPPIA